MPCSSKSPHRGQKSNDLTSSRRARLRSCCTAELHQTVRFSFDSRWNNCSSEDLSSCRSSTKGPMIMSPGRLWAEDADLSRRRLDQSRNLRWTSWSRESMVPFVSSKMSYDLSAHSSLGRRRLRRKGKKGLVCADGPHSAMAR